LYLHYEVYDAARGKNPAAASVANGPANSGANGAMTPNVNAATNEPAKTAPVKTPRDSVRVFTSIEFLQGSMKVYESKPIVANEVTAPDRKAVIFQIDLPLQALKPGFYVCQVNVVDDVSGNFAFPRSPILVKEAAQLSPAKPPAGK
jgi:hypothetical protein